MHIENDTVCLIGLKSIFSYKNRDVFYSTPEIIDVKNLLLPFLCDTSRSAHRAPSNKLDLKTPCFRSRNISDLQPNRAKRGYCKTETGSLLSHRIGGGTNNFSGLLPNSSTALHLVMTSRTDEERAP